nr:MAG TPA: hypothetical protein [Caudoviricetes sp.]
MFFTEILIVVFFYCCVLIANSTKTTSVNCLSPPGDG